jgi:hypothetical protein
MSHTLPNEKRQFSSRCAASVWSAAAVTLRSLLVIRLGEALWAYFCAVVLAAGTLGANFSGVALQANQSLKRTVPSSVARFARHDIVPRRLAQIR